MEFASLVVGPVVESLMVPVKRHLGYLFSSTHNVRTMNARMKQLDGKSVDIMKHKETNDRNTLEVPAGVQNWLEEVEKIKKEVQSISSNNNGSCFNLEARYQVGRKSWKKVLEIERLHTEGGKFHWSDVQIPLARVNTNRASASAPSRGDDFKSRDTIFKDALMFLQQDHKTQVIALCGMGGVGKTTMMEQLKKVVKDKKMFDWIVKVVLGKQPKTFSIQQVVAETLSHSLTEMEEETRAERLREIIEKILEKDKKGILVILDDVWENVELKDVGLSPLPNGVKLLLTSRDANTCRGFAVEAGNLHLEVLQVVVLEEIEAHKFFCQITGISEEHDPELYQIGGKIVKKCSRLPLAIKLIASTLKSESRSAIWRDRLRCLKKNGPPPKVHEIIEISYDNLKDYQEAKEIFLLCGLFPEDSNIRIEDLTRYAWGLQLLDGVSTLEDARDRTEACVSHLKNAHLLIDNDDPRYVKLHDLVLDFVLATVSKGDRASLIKHGDISTWRPDEMSESYKRISLSCKGLPEFPKSFKSPNLSLLKLMNGDDSFWFPEDFYGDTEKVEVVAYEKFVAYEKLQCPLLHRLLQCSTNLRTLCLHHCSLMFDFSFIGNLVNLEVLSFSHSILRELPSSIGNLKKLKLLDLTGCFHIKINDGVLKNLVKLEEIYMRDIGFTEGNSNELAGCSMNLFALEITCFENKGQLKNMSYDNLKRFKISMGSSIHRRKDMLKLFGNTLYLVTSKDELMESGLNGLLEKTEVLFLRVDGMRDLEDIEVKSLQYSLQYSSFCNLRFLTVSKCEELKYIFTLGVATALSKLEHLDISSCESMQELIHIESSGSETIKFPKLKFLSLDELPNLLSLCNTINVIELPQLIDLRLDGLPNFTSIYPKKKLATSSMAINVSAWQPFLNEELEKLRIHNMENLKEIWACQYSSSKEVDVCILREIDVKGCYSLVNLFPSNPMTLMHHLEDLKVANCGSIEALFNIDLGCVGEIEEVSCRLRSIQVRELWKLREVWRIKGANNMTDLHISAFQAVESIEIEGCTMLRNVFTPTNTNFDMRSLTNIIIRDSGESGRNNELLKRKRKKQEIDFISNEEISEVGDIISSVVFPSYLIHTVSHVQTLDICDSYKGTKTVFEIDSPSSRELATNHATRQLPLLHDLEDIRLEGMNCMSHVWKCNWKEFLIIQKQQPKRSFHNLTTIRMFRCSSIKYLFSSLMAELLCNLKEIRIKTCIVIEEVVSNKDDEDEERTTNTSTNLFPRLDILTLRKLPKLKRIGGGGGSNEISFNNTTTTIPIHDQFQVWHAAIKRERKRERTSDGQETQGGERETIPPTVPSFSQEDVVSWSLCQYSREIEIKRCDALSSALIPFNAVGQMQKLEKLTIKYCDSLVEVFETSNFDEGIPSLKTVNVPQLSNLKELKIVGCNLLQHVFTYATLESLWQLHELKIERCEAMKVIVKEETNQGQTPPPKVVVFPRLKTIALVDLPTLTGFFLGMNEFRWPLLDEVKIDACPQMTVFTRGCSEAPKVNNIYTNFGKHSLECGLNFPQTPCSSLDGTCSYLDTSEGIRWSFNNLIEIDVRDDHDVEQIIPYSELLQVQKLERIRISRCSWVEEVFEAAGKDSGLCELPFVVKIPNLREVELKGLVRLKYIWKTNPWMVLEFPNLTQVFIKKCRSLEHVFSSSMVGSLLQLQHLRIAYCESMEVIVKESNVVVEDDAKVNDFVKIPKLREVELLWLPSLKYIWKSNPWMVLEFPNLTKLSIECCASVEYVFSSSMVGSLLQLQHLHISQCRSMEVIVKEANVVTEEEEEEEEEECDTKIILPRLKSLILHSLPILKGFYLGKEAFSCPSLDTLEIWDCPAITVFTKAHSETPNLKAIDTYFGRYAVEEEEDQLNSFIKNRQQEGTF